MDQFFNFIINEIFVLSLSYLRMKSDELFSKADLFKKFGQKSSKSDQEAPLSILQNG